VAGGVIKNCNLKREEKKSSRTQESAGPLRHGNPQLRRYYKTPHVGTRRPRGGRPFSAPGDKPTAPLTATRSCSAAPRSAAGSSRASN